MFKVGDWITIKGTLPNDRFKLTSNEIKSKEILLGNFAFKEDAWELWQPQIGEWCWFYDTTKPYIIQYDGEELWQVEPFIGELPTFIKDK